MIVAGDVEVPDNCECCLRHMEGFSYQGDVCTRCPVFNCKGIFVGKDDPYADPEGYFSLLSPESFRRDWAIAYKEWFDSGCLGHPLL